MFLHFIFFIFNNLKKTVTAIQTQDPRYIRVHADPPKEVVCRNRK